MASNGERMARSFGLVQPQKLSEGITKGELASTLNEAGKEAERLVRFNMAKDTFSGTVEAQRMKAAMDGFGSLSSSIWGQVGGITRTGVHGAAELVANQQLDRDFLMGMPFNAIKQYSPGMFFNAFQSAEDIISRRTNGFRLADRIYKNGNLGVIQAGKQVEMGLALQESAKQVAARVRGLYRPDVPGGQSYAAMRLARTEINNAHHDTTIRLSKDLPWVLGYQWNISGSHPEDDICDDFAEADPDNMGQGVYKSQNVPDKPHPHCLCYIEVMQPDPDEFVDSLVDGYYDDFLDDMGVRC